jgi:hypothetical protein
VRRGGGSFTSTFGGSFFFVILPYGCPRLFPISLFYPSGENNFFCGPASGLPSDVKSR